MRKGSKGNGCNSASHRLFKDRAKNRVDDLQMIFSDLQSARKESRTVDAAVLEEQVYQMLREWKSELNEPSPASSLQNGSLDTFSSDIYRLLHLCEEEDDATSPFELPAPKSEPKSEPDVQKLQAGGPVVVPEGSEVKYEPDEKNLASVEECKDPSLGLHSLSSVNLDMANQLSYNQFNLPLGLENAYFSGFHGFGVDTLDSAHHISGLLPNISPPPSAFLGPKCALWDCPRPAQGSDWWQDYCSNFHATLALNEGPPGMTPVLRPGGIGLKDGLLFAALSAKAEGKDVGIPECAGAATAKSPWNAPELFDLSVLDGETIREWLFFDKPRRAFESGNRKQRSLPDYNGRGWHESRKQVMNEFNGLKRSYYMDPQPLNNYEWHLYEYEINNYDACALYRLELKLVVDGKKNSRGKASNDSVSELQKQMGRLTAEFPFEAKRPSRGRSKGNNKDGNFQSEYSTPNKVISTTTTTTTTSGEAFYCGTNGMQYGYLVKNLSEYYPDK